MAARNPTGRNELSPYTDGSKTKESTGSGVYSGDFDVKLCYRLSDWCTVFQAEIYAVWQAIKFKYSLSETSRNISIYIDSQAAIKALASNIVKSKLIRSTVALIRPIQQILCELTGAGKTMAARFPRHYDQDTTKSEHLRSYTSTRTGQGC